MAAISDREVEAISDRVTLKVRDLLDDHKEEMREHSRMEREVVVEAVTGFPWERRHEVRETITWASDQRTTHMRRKITIFGVLSALGLGHTWETIANFFSGKG